MDAKQFLAEFGHIINAPSGVQRVREMVYQLAILGDLTQQYQSDGNAQDLIEKIRAEKQRLVKKKKFKQSTKMEKNELLIPIELSIPSNWVWTNLVELGEINPKNEAPDNTLSSFIPMSGIPQIHNDKLKTETRAWGDIRKGFTQFANGDVVIAKITPCFENRKSAVIKGLHNGIGAGTTELHVIRPIKEFIEPTYIYIFSRSPHFMVAGEQKWS